MTKWLLISSRGSECIFICLIVLQGRENGVNDSCLSYHVVLLGEFLELRMRTDEAEDTLKDFKHYLRHTFDFLSRVITTSGMEEQA